MYATAPTCYRRVANFLIHMKHDDPEKLGNESAYEDATEMKRRMRRGDESKGDADERDVAGDYTDEHPETTDPARDQGLGGRGVPS